MLLERENTRDLTASRGLLELGLPLEVMNKQ